MKLLNHPSTVKLIETFGHGLPGSVIVMDFCEGKTFDDALNEKYNNVPIPIDVALDYSI